jgi:ABC-2 type transport system permease protein
MHKCWLLLKIQLLGLFGANRALHSNDKKEKRQLILMGALMLFAALVMAGYSAGIAIAFAYYGMAGALPPLILFLSAACTLAVTFLKSGGVLFGFRDYDMVMSLPVTKQAVIASRLLYVYAMNFLLSSAIMLPSIIVFAVSCSAPLPVWGMLALSMFLAPLLPMAASMAAGAAIAAISARFRYKNLLSVLFSTAAVLALLAGSFAIPQERAALAELVDAAVQSMYQIYPVAELYANALANNDWGSFGLFALVSIGASILFVLSLSALYSKINSALFAVRSKSDFRLGALKTSSAFTALYKKELRRFVSSPVYVMNTCIGAVLMVAAAASFLFADIEQIGNALGLPGIELWIKPMAPWAVASFAAISTATPSSISLEGNSRWLMCSAPVPARVIFNSKIAVTLSYLAPSALISSSLLAARLQASALETIALFAVPLLFSAFISVVGLAINLKFPKYGWTSEYQAVKQSVSVLATMGTGIGTVLFLSVAAFLLKGIPALALALPIILLVSATALVYRKLGAQKLYV